MKNGKNNSKKNYKKPPYKGYHGTKNQRRAEEIADTAVAESRSNPISFYNKYNNFMTDAAKLPFSYPLGYKFDNLFSGPNSPVVIDQNDFVVPGLMTLRFTPTIGVSHDFTSPINRSSIQFWTYLRSIMKAAGDYDHQDITMMTLALDSCVMFHSLLRRIYGLLPDVTPLNKYYAKAIINACGVNYDDLVKNIQDFRAYINEFAYRLQQYAIPKDIELINRHSWMCEGIYTDSVSTRAQTYMFLPFGFWQYDNTVETGSQLIFKYWSYDPSTGLDGQYTYAQIMQFGNELINAISGDADFAMISGDMFTLYKGNTYTLPYVTEGYQILPKYDQVVLSQIENATILGVFDSSYTPVISQNPGVNAGAIIFEPVMYTPNASFYGDAAINIHYDNPSPDQVVEATRLCATVTPNLTVTSNTVAYVKSCGTEIINLIKVFKLAPATDQAIVSLSVARRKHLLSDTVNQENLNGAIGIVSAALNLAQFDWAPRIEIYQTYTTETSTEYHIIGTTWDIDDISDVDSNQLAIIHDACLWSEFDVPRMSAGR